MKTSLVVFLLLLFALILAVLFSRFYKDNIFSLYSGGGGGLGYSVYDQEGFISFNESTQDMESVYIPQYSTTSNNTVKLHDNIFFDRQNANLVEVDGTAAASSGNVGGTTDDLKGLTINGIYVVKRDDSSNVVPYTTQWADTAHTSISAGTTAESQIATIKENTSQYVYTTQSKNTDKYQVFYYAWDDKTFLHIIKLGQSPEHTNSFYFDKTSLKMKKFDLSSQPFITSTQQIADGDIANNTDVINAQYSPTIKVFQLSHNVQFDKINGNLIIVSDETPTGTTKTASTIKVYDRYGNLTTSYTATSTQSVQTFQPWIVSDGGSNMVFYSAVDTLTLVSIIGLKSGSFNIINTGRFVYNTTPTPPPTPTQTPPTQNNVLTLNDNVTPISSGGGSGDSTLIGNNTANPTNTANANVVTGSNSMSDYILKTQIVPPVCPSCPSCPSCSGGTGGTVCTSCGGNGGAGTKLPASTPQPSQQSAYNSYNHQNYSVNNKGTTVDKNGNVVSLTKNGYLSNDNTDTFGGSLTAQTGIVVAGVDDIAKTGAGILNNVIDSTEGILTNTGNAIFNGSRQSGSGNGSYYQQPQQQQPHFLTLGSGYNNSANYLQQKPQQQQQQQPIQASYNNMNTVPGIDTYSAFGSLQEKGSNYRPITSSFAAFS